MLGWAAVKMYSKILAICVFHASVWGTTAFAITKARTILVPKTVLWMFHNQDPVSPSFTYLGNLGPSESSRVFDTSTMAEYDYTFPQAGNGRRLVSGRENKPVTIVDTRPMRSIRNVWDTISAVQVHGDSLRTWSFRSPDVKRVQVVLRSEGRPIRANVELWQGPDNSPQRMAIYNEDGNMRPFCAVIETPRGQNSIAIRNTGHVEFPLTACLRADVEDETGRCSLDLESITRELHDTSTPKIIQGGALQTYPFDSSVASVQVMLKTDMRPLNARIELLQGPNNNKQVIEVYCENGLERPFFAVIETPGSGNVIRIVNTATMEFPLTARVEPYILEYSTAEGVYDTEALFVLDDQQ